jgi:hypothetical protein
MDKWDEHTARREIAPRGIKGRRPEQHPAGADAAVEHCRRVPSNFASTCASFAGVILRY